LTRSGVGLKRLANCIGCGIKAIGLFMNVMLKMATGVLLAANVVYPFSKWVAQGEGVSQGVAHPVKNAAALSPTLASTRLGSEACLKISGLSLERKIEALELLGSVGKPRGFEQVDEKNRLTSSKELEARRIWQVRFGPWQKNGLEQLKQLLAKWGSERFETCSDKEREEWEKLK
jgi:hypothetical protein